MLGSNKRLKRKAKKYANIYRKCHISVSKPLKYKSAAEVYIFYESLELCEILVPTRTQYTGPRFQSRLNT